MQRNIIHLPETDSTNRYLHDMEISGSDVMTVAVADYQTAGKGQGTNRWESERGKNLLVSVMLCHLPVEPTRQFLLSEAGALAVGTALSSYTGGITLKWPNDIYYNDLKLSGTLIETSIGGTEIRRCIFGIGINVNQDVFRSDAPNPVSLRQILGHELSVDEVLAKVLDAMEQEMEPFFASCYASVSERYHSMLYRREGYHWYRDEGGYFEAKIQAVEDDGHLLLADKSGLLRRYAFKEVEFRPHPQPLSRGRGE